jgi:hypothetical protein
LSPGVPRQPGQHSGTLSQKNENCISRNNKTDFNDLLTKDKKGIVNNFQILLF